ncbi:Sialin [Penaeus vannamei]|uniref:Sialin n=1 Tax=Penaeus vannamei TaxID=6689 RepID=A0A3R7PMM9_PENVA|nr:Sialin [Penaeus vannamei]
MTYESPYDEEVEVIPLLRREKQTGWRWSPRYTVAVLGCLGILVEYCQRVNLSIAIVAMAGSSGTNGSHTLDVCPDSHNSSSGAPTQQPLLQPLRAAEFAHWDSRTQGLLLSSFFWGYAATQRRGGRGRSTWGGRWCSAPASSPRRSCRSSRPSAPAPTCSSSWPSGSCRDSYRA